MATITANFSFDQRFLDLSKLYLNYYDFYSVENANFQYNDNIYIDLFEVDWQSNGSYYASVFAGPDIQLVGSEIYGIVSGYGEFIWDGGEQEYLLTWIVEDVYIDANSLFNAAKTASTLDEYSIINAALSGADKFYLSDYSDRVYGYGGNDIIYGQNGNDTLYGGNNNDKLYGGSGNDRSYGEAGNDSLYMDAGNDTLDGGSGIDWLYVTGSTNSVVNLAKTTGQNTGYGTDIIKNIENASGGSGVDKFYGTSGNNTLKGNNGNDLLYGQNGNDTLYGGNNNDRLYGGSGNDTLRGDAGRDILQGNAGKDTLFGGADADTFVFRKTSDSSASASSADIIRDFTRGSDKIDLHYIDASTKLSGNNAFTFDGTKSFGTSKEGDIYYKQFNNAGTSNDYTMVYIDTDNDTGTEMSIKLMGLHALTASDFIL